jgi:hypothetical protein
MAFCTKCGNQLKAGDEFCSNCGQPVQPQETTIETKQDVDEVKGNITGAVLDEEIVGHGLKSTTKQKINTVDEEGNVVGTILSGKGGTVNVGGEHHTGDRVEGDKVGGDKVGGDKTTVGNISESKGIAVGREASATVTETHGLSDEALAKLFDTIYQQVESNPALSTQEKDDVKADVDDLKAEADKDPADVDESFLARRLRNIERMAPDIIDTIATTIVNPVAGVVSVWQKIANKAQELQAARAS